MSWLRSVYEGTRVRGLVEGIGVVLAQPQGTDVNPCVLSRENCVIHCRLSIGALSVRFRWVVIIQAEEPVSMPRIRSVHPQLLSLRQLPFLWTQKGSAEQASTDRLQSCKSLILIVLIKTMSIQKSVTEPIRILIGRQPAGTLSGAMPIKFSLKTNKKRPPRHQNSTRGTPPVSFLCDTYSGTVFPFHLTSNGLSFQRICSPLRESVSRSFFAYQMIGANTMLGEVQTRLLLFR